MAYNPQVTPWSPTPADYTAGTSRANAITNVGNSIVQGMNQWYQNDKQDTLTRSQVAGLLPQFADKLTNPEDKKAVEKFINHKSDYKTNGYLLGLLSTLKAQDEDRTKQQYIQAQTALQQQALLAQQKAMAHQQFLNNVANGNTSPYRTDPTKNPLVMQAAQLYKATGQVPTPDNLLDSQARMAAVSSKPALKIGLVHSTDGKGRPIEISVNQLTGEELGRSPVMPLAGTPEQQAETASLVEQAKQQAEAGQKFVTEIADNAEAARVRASTIKRVASLYNAGAVSGFGQQNLTALQAALGRVGLAKSGLADQQALNKELSNLAMETGRDLMKGGGSVSNYERQLIQNSTASPSLDPAANMKILQVMSAIAERAMILDRKRQELDDAGVSTVEAAKQLRKLRDSIPVGLEALGANPADAILSKYGIPPPK